jgi:hypothetical protein
MHITGSNALTHGITPNAPASIKPVDINAWKGKIEPEFKHYFEEKYNHLVRQYEELVDEYNINKLVYESDINFKPLIGNVYYLYEKEDGRRFISILSFNETRWTGYLGAFRLKTQYTWEKID